MPMVVYSLLLTLLSTPKTIAIGSGATAFDCGPSQALQSLIDEALVSSPIVKKASWKLLKTFLSDVHMVIVSNTSKRTSSKNSKPRSSQSSFGRQPVQQRNPYSIKLSKIWPVSISSHSLGYYRTRKLSTGRSSTSLDVFMAISPRTLQNLSIHGFSKRVKSLSSLCLRVFVIN
jgi:hypothetical protein